MLPPIAIQSSLEVVLNFLSRSPRRRNSRGIQFVGRSSFQSPVCRVCCLPAHDVLERLFLMNLLTCCLNLLVHLTLSPVPGSLASLVPKLPGVPHI